jgi:hypothetical protein
LGFPQNSSRVGISNEVFLYSFSAKAILWAYTESFKVDFILHAFQAIKLELHSHKNPFKALTPQRNLTPKILTPLTELIDLIRPIRRLGSWFYQHHRL